jgi:hypothetical protein
VTSGAIVQLPLPAHLNSHEVLQAIPVDKDVDGLHPYNLGRVRTSPFLYSFFFLCLACFFFFFSFLPRLLTIAAFVGKVRMNVMNKYSAHRLHCCSGVSFMDTLYNSNVTSKGRTLSPQRLWGYIAFSATPLATSQVLSLSLCVLYHCECVLLTTLLQASDV